LFRYFEEVGQTQEIKRMETECETKPQDIKNKEQFEKMASEMLSHWTEYKKLDARMKLLDASTKKYMIDNKMKVYESKSGEIVIVEQLRRVLDRSLIEDIEQYKIDAKVKLSFKSPTI
jgi:hypothetical protein